MNDQTTYDINDKTPATPETDEEILDRIAGEILDARLEDEEQCLRERREEEGAPRTWRSCASITNVLARHLRIKASFRGGGASSGGGVRS